MRRLYTEKLKHYCIFVLDTGKALAILRVGLEDDMLKEGGENGQAINDCASANQISTKMEKQSGKP